MIDTFQPTKPIELPDAPKGRKNEIAKDAITGTTLRQRCRIVSLAKTRRRKVEPISRFRSFALSRFIIRFCSQSIPMPDALIPTRFLFRFSLPCRYRETLWTAKGTGLDESFRLPSFAELEQLPEEVEVRAAWNESGVAFWIRVMGKKQAPWCRANKPEDSDGFHLWLDTRDVHNVHRASRFCHQFALLPAGAGRNLDEPAAVLLPIHRAKELPRPLQPGQIKLRSERQKDGYLLEAFMPAEALTGYDPGEHPRLGFNYAVIDRELGDHVLTVGRPMPYDEDPSLWATLELVRD